MRIKEISFHAQKQNGPKLQHEKMLYKPNVNLWAENNVKFDQNNVNLQHKKDSVSETTNKLPRNPSAINKIFIWILFSTRLIVLLWLCKSDSRWWRFDVRWRPLNDNSMWIRVVYLFLAGSKWARDHEASVHDASIRDCISHRHTMTLSFIVIMEFYYIDWSANHAHFAERDTPVIIVYPREQPNKNRSMRCT